MKTTLLIDADILAYKVANANERKYKFGGENGNCVHVGKLDKACDAADRIIKGWVALLKADDVIICLSCPTAEGFRLNKVLSTYKGQRNEEGKPQQLAAVKTYLSRAYDSKLIPELEADDVMGILSTHPLLVEGKKIIVSEDKDMNTIPGYWYNPRKNKGRARKISEQEANRFHMLQTLMGDTVDHYTGIPGRGIKFATKLLDEAPYEHMWNYVAQAYRDNGLTEDDALVQARCARILRHTDYNFPDKEVILWQPV